MPTEETEEIMLQRAQQKVIQLSHYCQEWLPHNTHQGVPGDCSLANSVGVYICKKALHNLCRCPFIYQRIAKLAI